MTVPALKEPPLHFSWGRQAVRKSSDNYKAYQIMINIMEKKDKKDNKGAGGSGDSCYRLVIK